MTYYNEIFNLVQSNPEQLTINEYTFISNKIQEYTNCNFLVFGLGRDSILWDTINNNGKTIFIEHDPYWISLSDPKLDIRKIEYTTDISEAFDIIDDPDRLYIELDKDIIETNWDLIFIDSPTGYLDSGVAGRMQSIYTASTLRCTDYILHDINRDVERIYGDKYLGCIDYTLDRMNYYNKY